MRIRADLTASHDRIWQQLAAPGAWLTGNERVAVARELRAARNCPLCQERKTSLSPGAIKGHHEAVNHDMPTARVELIHKLMSDPGRITRSWVRELLASGLEDTEYVEIAGLVSAVTVVDTFHAALGLPLRPLPDPSRSIEFDFDEHELRGGLREALFDGPPVLVELDAVDLGVARERAEKAPHAFA